MSRLSAWWKLLTGTQHEALAGFVRVADPAEDVHIWTSKGLLPEKALTVNQWWEFSPNKENCKSIAFVREWTYRGEIVKREPHVYGNEPLPNAFSAQGQIS